MAWVYYNPETIKHKKLAFFSPQSVYKAFDCSNTEVFTDSKVLYEMIRSIDWDNKNLLIMTSGNFDGIDFRQLVSDITDK